MCKREVVNSVKVRKLEREPSSLLHVSSPMRATGIGRRLSDELEQIARAAGDSEMVVTATPSENTVRFYLSRGFRPMADPLADLFELEPEDIHMSKRLWSNRSGRSAVPGGVDRYGI